MSKLVVIAYDDQFKAEEVRTKLRKLQQDHLIDLEEALVAVKDDQGEVTLLQMSKPAAEVEARKGFWNTLVGAIVMEPGARHGQRCARRRDQRRAGGRRRRRGFPEGSGGDFQERQFGALRAGSVRRVPSKVLAALQGTGGKVLETTLSHQDEAKLQAALKAAPAAG
jgi:uncharacterized membrane protein